MTDAVRDYLNSDAAKQQGNTLTAAIARKPKNFNAARPAHPELNPNIPPDVYPDALGEANDSICRTKGRNALEALLTVHQKLIQTAMLVENKAELAKQVQPVALKAMRSMKNEIDGLDRQWVHFDQEIDKAVGTGIGALAGEVRQIVREMPEAERPGFVRKLIAEESVEGLKAVAALPAYMTGIDTEHWALARETLERLVAAKAFEERAEASAALQRCRRAYEHFDENIASAIKQWNSSDDAHIATLLNSLNRKVDTNG